MALFDKSELGKRIVELQKALGKNSRQFALEADLDVSYLAKIEKGEKPLSKNYLDKIESKYHVNREWVLTGKGEMFRPNVPQGTKPADSLLDHMLPKSSEAPTLESLARSLELSAQARLIDAESRKLDMENRQIEALNVQRLINIIEQRFGIAGTSASKKGKIAITKGEKEKAE